jgi:hypothetical protein
LRVGVPQVLSIPDFQETKLRILHPNSRKETFMKHVTLWMILIAIACSASAQNSPLGLVDHFRCYPFPQQPGGATMVWLSDQFTPTLFHLSLSVTPAEFCNPVQKTVNGTVTPILDPNHHFVMYVVAIPTTGYEATISNQFGTQKLAMGGPTILAVPAGLPPLAPSTDLDHYGCYSAQAETQFNPIQVTLQDSFITETITVVQPVFFCNPTIKNHNGTTTILHPDTHLTCYSTSPSNFQGGNVNTTDQFFLTAAYTIQAPGLLCVPSLKLSWQVGISE